MTPNQIVAWNLRRARTLRGWTQAEAAEQLEPHLGERWSKATYSAAERSVDGDRIRHFNADEIYAFSQAFEVPITLLFTPPPWSPDVGHAKSSQAIAPAEYLDSIFDLDPDARRRMLGEIVPMTAGTTLSLRRWLADFAAMVDERESQVEALLGVRDTRTTGGEPK